MRYEKPDCETVEEFDVEICQEISRANTQVKKESGR